MKLQCCCDIPGEWTETISRKAKHEKKVKERKDEQPIKEEVTEQDEVILDKAGQRLPDNEVLEVAPAEEMGSSALESSGRASTAASTNSNTDSSDFVHIEMRAGGEGDVVSVEVVDPPVGKRKAKKRMDETQTKTETVRDISDSPKEGKAALKQV